MNESLIKSVLFDLDQEQAQLTQYVNSQLDGIQFPDESPVFVNENKSSDKQRKYIIAAGVALFTIGLAAHKTFLAVVGGIAAGAGVYMQYKRTKEAQGASQNTPSSVNYVQFGSKVYDVIESVHSHVSSQWDSFISGQYEKIKVSLISENDNDVAINDALLSHSVITYSVLNTFSEIMSAARKNDMNEIRKVITAFQSSYSSVIISAVNAEKNKINGFLNR